jgi:hypothetical protein
MESVHYGYVNFLVSGPASDFTLMHQILGPFQGFSTDDNWLFFSLIFPGILGLLCSWQQETFDVLALILCTELGSLNGVATDTKWLVMLMFCTFAWILIPTQKKYLLLIHLSLYRDIYGIKVLYTTSDI